MPSTWKIKWDIKAEKELKSLDYAIQKRIIKSIETKLILNPMMLGKKLVAEWNQKWSYRIGAYRIVYTIEEEDLIILIITVNHRKEVYKVY